VIAAHRVLAIIAARGGSKGIPRKNLRQVAGKPLIAWSIEAARAARYVDRVITSSDDDAIVDTARKLGCDVPFVRPADLARDDTPGIEPVLHALSILPDYDIVVLLQPTSPLRTAQDIDACVEQLVTAGAPSCVSICEAETHPYLTYERTSDGSLRSFVTAEVANMRRQDFPPAWRLNGAVYAARVAWLIGSRSFLNAATIGYPMPAARSLDIDTAEDLAAADAALAPNFDHCVPGDIR
jgi:CMP-N,N'-diacetyllegionaminic acid synthase